ncbi:tRNA isopentenyltransferase [Amniculicola lignicola CBS 123094]|uniref:tRNA dimethylallyltransferase n=1 Tax=Amniculicola lignicola CBS 123094 TaxID=1392246 RepID=A0A6A5WVN7_9PLEO|nr:tRNA isopentenyltransferase [Amniculicola lignicola CBS 123094]
MAKAPPVRPLVAIVGATGTGKSDLAVEIARKFDGEIVNGDAMQLYEGLPIITNKVTQDEMKGVPHHLLGCIKPEEETWTVGKFVANALGVIDEIRSRGKLPILVGGTHYYTQSLLFQDGLSDEPIVKDDENREHLPILDEPTDIILEKLKEVDPVMAERWHPSERRKIMRSLEIYLRTGKPASQVYDEQRARNSAASDGTGLEEGGPVRSGPSLRFPTLVFWVDAARDILTSRLDARIEKMLGKGLLSEVETLSNFRTAFEERLGCPVDITRGIWVSIGYKEFLDYQSALQTGSISEKELVKLKTSAIEKTQAATRQYAKRQIQWIRIKLLNALSSAGQKSCMFLLDGSDLSLWEDHVLTPARDVTSKFISGEALPEPTELSDAAREMLNPKRDYDLSQRPDLWEKKICDVCGTLSVTPNDWEQHNKSRAHRRAVVGKKKRDLKKQRSQGEARPNEIDNFVDDVLQRDSVEEAGIDNAPNHSS